MSSNFSNFMLSIILASHDESCVTIDHKLIAIPSSGPVESLESRAYYLRRTTRLPIVSLKASTRRSVSCSRSLCPAANATGKRSMANVYGHTILWYESRQRQHHFPWSMDQRQSSLCQPRQLLDDLALIPCNCRRGRRPAVPPLSLFNNNCIKGPPSPPPLPHNVSVASLVDLNHQPKPCLVRPAALTNQPLCVMWLPKLAPNLAEGKARPRASFVCKNLWPTSLHSGSTVNVGFWVFWSIFQNFIFKKFILMENCYVGMIIKKC